MAAEPQPLQEAGLSLEYQDDGTRLVVRDSNPDGCPIRTRGGAALAKLISENRSIRSLDISESQISDNGIGQLCLMLRQTDQLEDLSLSPVGHVGLEFLLGVVRRCERLSKLRVDVRDVATLHVGRQNLGAADYITAGEQAEPAGEEEDEEDEEEEEEEEDLDEEELEERAQKKAEQLRALFAENDYDSGDEGGGKARSAASDSRVAATSSPALLQLLTDFVAAVRKKETLVEVTCRGEAVPADLQLDLQRVLEDHRETAEKALQKRQQQRNVDMHAGLNGQLETLLSDLLQISAWKQRAPAEEPKRGEEDRLGSDAGEGITSPGSGVTRLGLRHYLGRELVAPLGEALFECQRFKSKDNEAVSTPQGEMAFIAMYLKDYLASQRKGRISLG